jgi:transcriptional antiterminator NusG
MGRMSKEEPKFEIDFRVGEFVKIIDGPFKDYDGRVSEIDEEHGKIKVMVPVFGRDTSVEINSLQVQKL